MGMVLSYYAALLAEQLGLSVPELCAESGLTPEEIWDRKIPISSAAHQAFLNAMVRHTGDENLFLRPLDPGLASLDNPLWYYILNAKTVRDLMTRGERAYLFLSDFYYPKTIELGREAETQWVCRVVDYPTLNQQVDWMFAGWWGTLERFAGPDLKLKAVRLAQASPSRVAAYEKFFKVPIEVGTPKDALVFDIDMLDLPNIRKDIDPNLDQLLSRYITEGMPTSQIDTDVFRGAFDAVQHQLLHGTPTIDQVARKLGMSARTLQRRLREQDKSFSELVRDVRRELSASYLLQDGLAVTEIAFMLGFSNANSFSKFFRESYGLSPSQYRERPQSPPPLSVN